MVLSIDFQQQGLEIDGIVFHFLDFLLEITQVAFLQQKLKFLQLFFFLGTFKVDTLAFAFDCFAFKNDFSEQTRLVLSLFVILILLDQIYDGVIERIVLLDQIF